jgi:hypothetical protein
MCPTLPKAYQERPQSYIKHLLLESYLEKLVLIVGRGASQICYVDCFAGPWGGGSDDMASTSIGISLTTLNKCRESPAGVVYIPRCGPSTSNATPQLSQRYPHT